MFFIWHKEVYAYEVCDGEKKKIWGKILKAFPPQ